jgi:hypothetical protein
MWGVTSGTGSAGTVAWTQISRFNGGAGAAVTFSPASPVTGPLAVAPVTLPVTWLDFPYVSRTLTATGGKPPYTWTVTAGSLPPGMSLSSAGVLSGSSVTAAGTYGFTVQVTDGNASTATAGQAVTVNPPPPGFPALSTGSASNTSLPPGSAYYDPSICPASNGSNSYVSADWVQPTGSYSQTIGAYSPSVFYVTANGAPAGTGQVQAYPNYTQQWNNWGGTTWNGLLNTPLSAFKSLTVTFDVTVPLTGSYELGADLWTGYTTTNNPATGVPQDVMVWPYTSPERAIGNAAPLFAPDVTIGAFTYDVYGSVGSEIIFAIQGPGGTGTYAQMTSGTIDVLGPILWCQSHGLNMGSPPFFSAIDFGWEICNTDTYLGSGVTQTENFIVNDFTYVWQLAGQPPASYRPNLVNRVATIPARIG